MRATYDVKVIILSFLTTDLVDNPSLSSLRLSELVGYLSFSDGFARLPYKEAYDSDMSWYSKVCSRCFLLKIHLPFCIQDIRSFGRKPELAFGPLFARMSLRSAKSIPSLSR